MPKSNRKVTKRPQKIYLDYASATPVDLEVSSTMEKFAMENFANPSAIHSLGVAMKNKLEEAREGVGKILGAHRDEIVFTSGATESNNLAILGVVNKFKELNPSKIPHIVTTNIEHASVLEVCRHLEKTKRAQVTYVEVEKNGIVDLKKIRKAIKPSTILVSVMYANNEIGTIQPIREIAKEIRHFRSKGKATLVSKNVALPLLHIDATQAINYLPINVERLGVDLMSLNGAKIYGPKGVGALYVKRNTPITKIIFGGDQELTLRPGTENVASVVGLFEALKIVEKIKEKESKRIEKLRDYFIDKLFHSNVLTNIGIIINGDLQNRLPNNVNITIPNIPSDLLVIELDAHGIMASAKSACKAGDNKASHVINAINPKIKEVDGSLRFSLGRSTTKKEIDQTIRALSEILNKLKRWYN